MKKTFTLGLVLVLLLSGVGAVSAANLVTNGGFESSSPVPPNPGWLTCPGGVLNGWTIGGNIDVIRTYWQNASGSQSIDLAGNQPGTISQPIPTVPGKLYDLSFAMAGNPDGNPTSTTKRVEVFWGGASQGIFSFSTVGKTRPAMGWVTNTIPNLAGSSGPTTELKFVDMTGSNYFGAALDDIVVEPQPTNTPVPEFPTMALPVGLIVGLLGAVLFIQKSKDN